MIKINNLNKYYTVGKGKNKDKTQALNNINLTVNDGETVAVQGESGAGKSTLLNILGLLDSYDSGSYTLDGVEINSLNDKNAAKLRNQKIGFVLQEYSLLESKSVEMNVMLPLFFGNCKYAQMKEKANEALSLVGLSNQRGKTVNQLSGGQKQRVAIARAIITKPSVILADEPTAALDKETASLIMKLLIELNRAFNTTLIVVTHDDNIANYCNRKLTISNGILSE